MPRVAVNVVTWNSADEIDACLDAVFRQTYTDFCVTVVDNGSTDDSPERVQKWADRGVTLLPNATNEGYARAHNKAIRATDSDFVLTLNPDLILAPTYVERILEATEADAAYGSAAGKLLRISPEQFRQGLAALEGQSGHVIDSAGLILYKNRRQFLRGHLQDAAAFPPENAPIFGPDGAAAFYRRAMLEDVKIEGEYFDELFVTHKEDVDLAWRAQLLGWRSVYAPQAAAYHIRGFRPGERKPLPAKVKRDAVKNRWLLLIKNERPRLFLRDLPRIAFYDLKILGYLLLFEQTSLLAIGDCLRLLPAMLRRRRDIQGRRKSDDAYLKQWFI